MRRQRQSSRKLFAQNTRSSPLRTAGRVAISTRLGGRSASVSRPHERKNTAAQLPISIILDSNQRPIQGQGRNQHRSITAIACAWFRRNVFQLCEGGVPP